MLINCGAQAQTMHTISVQTNQMNEVMLLNEYTRNNKMLFDRIETRQSYSSFCFGAIHSLLKLINYGLKDAINTLKQV